MAEVCPTEKDGGPCLNRMLSIHLHVSEEPVAVGETGGDVTTNIKRWVSTDVLGGGQNGDGRDLSTSVQKQLPQSLDVATVQVSNGRLSNGKTNRNNYKKNGKKNGTVDVHLSDISEHGSVLNKESSGKRHVKKRWRIKRIFGIKS